MSKSAPRPSDKVRGGPYPIPRTGLYFDVTHVRKLEEAPMATQELPTLYERLGGVYSIATVMDDFINRIMIDPRLNANPKIDEAHHRVSPAGFKYLVTEMVCWATGGPQKYTGRSMKETHQHLMITAAEWEAFSTISSKPLTSSLSPRPSRQRSRPLLPAHERISSSKC